MSESRGVRGRYAPSPTGDLHLGNLRTALLAWLFCRKAGGTFLLRMEDLDLPRVRTGAASRILDDLRWLGLDWDEGPDVGGPLGPYIQNVRQDVYRAAIARLRGQGLIYPCYCTRAELARIASAPHGDEGPIYPGTCRHLSANERAQHEAAGRRPALRFKVPWAPITFTDHLHGSFTECLAETTGDFIIRRSDGIVSYQLAVVVDDALMAITQVVRGQDLLSSTARQLALFDALGYPRPTEFAHVPLAVDAAGARLAKRDAAHGIAALRRSGTRPATLAAALAASAGVWTAGKPAMPHEMLDAFSPTRLAHAPSEIAISR